MPITKSAKKALRQSQKRRIHRLGKIRELKKLLKKVKLLVSEKKLEQAKKLLPQTYKTLDKAAKANLIKKNTANRRKSTIAKLVDKN